MGAISFTATLQPRGPAAAVVLDDQVALDAAPREVEVPEALAQALEMLREGRTRS